MIVRLTRPALLSIFICMLPAPWVNAAISPSQRQTPATAAPAASQPPGTNGNAAAKTDYLIGEDDVLEINVWNEPDMKQSLPVRSDGKITLPLIGEVQAAGETPLQLQQAIATKLTAYIQHPDVTVIVAQMNSRKFNILGRVAKPGSYPLTATTTVLDAIAVAGGFQDFAKQKDIYVLRKNSAGTEIRIPFNYKSVIKGNHSEENIALQPHDTVVVP
jgi:polysaccharide biosynthesis/export protein